MIFALQGLMQHIIITRIKNVQKYGETKTAFSENRNEGWIWIVQNVNGMDDADSKTRDIEANYKNISHMIIFIWSTLLQMVIYKLFRQ